MEILDKIVAIIQEYSGTAVIVGAFVLDLVLRLVKTEKPKSVLVLVAGILGKVGDLFKAVSGLLNKIVPDRTV